MKKDIDRLHAVIQKKLYGRGAGKTTAIIYNLIGIIELGESRDIVLLISHFNDIYYLRKMIYDIFEEYGLKITEYKRDSFMCNNKRIHFSTPDKSQDTIRGLHADVSHIGHNN